MKVLALESSTALGSVTVLENNKILFHDSSLDQRTHSEFLNQSIARALHELSLRIDSFDLFACGIGPGSFTGVRVAGNIIKSFAYICSTPMVVADSLALLQSYNFTRLSTASLESSIPKTQLEDLAQAYLINAHKNMVYASFYSGNERLTQPEALTIMDLERQIVRHFGKSQKVAIFGDGVLAYHKLLSNELKARLFHREFNLDIHNDYPSATTLAHFAFNSAKLGQTIEWKNYLPLYIRASEAEENLRVN